MSRPKSAAVNDVDIADILDQKYPYYIDNGKGDIDPPLIQSDRVKQNIKVGLPVNEKLSYSIILLLEHNILPTSIPKALSLQLDIPLVCDPSPVRCKQKAVKWFLVSIAAFVCCPS